MSQSLKRGKATTLGRKVVVKPSVWKADSGRASGLAAGVQRRNETLGLSFEIRRKGRVELLAHLPFAIQFRGRTLLLADGLASDTPNLAA